jgi:cell division protein FtsL
MPSWGQLRVPHPVLLRRFRPIFLRSPLVVLVLAGLVGTAGSAAGQTAAVEDTNILFPVDYIEARLLAPELEIRDVDRARPLEADRSRRVMLGGPDGEPTIPAHWKPVMAPGRGFNNEPRYELAAYRLQKMFLEEHDYVVPPTVLRALPIEEYRRIRSATGPTIPGTSAVLFLLSYWVQNLAVDTVDPFDQDLFDRDEVYARHFANANLLTHLIDHKDGNHGNVLVSMDHANRRVFAVDNDVAFRSETSELGDRWRRLHVDRLPAGSIERLRSITREQLDEELGVVAEFRIVDRHLERVEPGPNLRAGQGVRIREGRVQLGLTRAEIGDIERRITRLLRDVDRGRISTF